MRTPLYALAGSTVALALAAVFLIPSTSAQSARLADPVAASHWTPVFSEDFNTGADIADASWYKYVGISTASGSEFRPSNVQVRDGSLVLTTRKTGGVWSASGVGSRLNLVYGRWTVRARTVQARGVTLVALLWPTSDRWPPEIDFAEDNGGDRASMNAAVHFPDGSTQYDQVAVDSTQWHDYTVEWSPGRISYLVDGQVWASVGSDKVPNVPMRLALQSEPWVKGTTFNESVTRQTPTQVEMLIDSVQISSYQR
jgi:beta-glucanase (GH16 family)